jgi:tetratricopeptide (TPR) repeat protein
VQPNLLFRLSTILSANGATHLSLARLAGLLDAAGVLIGASSAAHDADGDGVDDRAQRAPGLPVDEELAAQVDFTPPETPPILVEAVNVLQENVRVAERVGDPRLSCDAFSGVADGLRAAGRGVEAVEVLERVYALSKELGDPGPAAQRLGNVYSAVDRRDEASKLFTEAFNLAVERRRPPGVIDDARVRVGIARATAVLDSAVSKMLDDAIFG